MVQEISYVNSQNNKYVILNRQSSKRKKKLNMQANVKTKNGKKLKVKALVDSRCTYIEIDKQLVKDKRIQTKLINFSFKVFNADGVVATTYHEGQMISLTSKPQSRSIMWEFTRELDKKPLLN